MRINLPQVECHFFHGGRYNYSCFIFLDVKLPNQVQNKIQSYHSATNEILRHFWSSFEPFKADKNARMVESLKQQQAKLKEILVTVVSYDGDEQKCKHVSYFSCNKKTMCL